MKERKKLFSHLWDLPYGRTTPYNLFDASKNSRELVQKFQLQKKIPVHNGCVNSICWNENGRYLLSGSDDQHLSIVQGYDYSVLAYIRTGHRANIFSAKFLPNSGDSHVVSSSGDGIIIYSDLERSDSSMNNKFTCHNGTAYEIMTVPNDPNTFLSCGEDKTVRWFDIRTKTSCDIDSCKDDILIYNKAPVTSIAVNPLIPYQLAVGCADSSVQIFDRRMLSTRANTGCLSNGLHALMTMFTVPDFPQSRRITSLCYSADGREMLVSYSSDYIYLFDVKDDMGKRPKVLSSSDSSNRTRPLMKRLRVRGDWSDTGPNSRPETEAGGNRDNSPNNLVRRMTDILTRMLFRTRGRQSLANQSSSGSSPPTSTHSDEGEMEAGSDSNNDEGARNNQPEETNNEQSASLASEENENENSNDSVAVKDSTTDQVNSDAATNCAFVVCPHCSHTVETPPLTCPQDLPSTSGEQRTCQSSTVIKDSCVTTSNEVMLTESTPSTSSHSVQTDNENAVIDKNPSEAEESLNAESNTVASKQSLENEKAVQCYIPRKPEESPNAENNTVVSKQSSENEKAVQCHIPRSNVVSEDNGSMEALDGSNASVERGSESETETAVQSIQPSEHVPVITELQSPRSPSPEVLEENAEEVELMMEVDSWDSDSDDGTQANTSQNIRRTRRRVRVSSSCDENDPDQKDEIRKEKPPRNVNHPKVKSMYTGHRNARTMIKESTFWGDNFVMSGSDCGHIFIWDRHTTELVMIMEADHHVVNCLQPHPFDPILASSGIDYDIKIWAPLREEPFFDVEKANEIVKRNEIMLEVTKDTITVPASFMFNMFNTLNHLRNGHRHRWSRGAGRASSSSETNNR